MDNPTFSTPDFGSSPQEYLNNVRTELRKVQWPNRQQVVRATILVFSVSAVVGTFLGSLDFLFTNLFQTILS